MSSMSELDLAVQEYCNHLLNDYRKTGHNMDKHYVYEIGRKYIHVIMQDNQRSSHSWIVMKPDAKFAFGDILKSASWKKPATNFKRGNVLDVDSYKNIRWAGV